MRVSVTESRTVARASETGAVGGAHTDANADAHRRRPTGARTRTHRASAARTHARPADVTGRCGSGGNTKRRALSTDTARGGGGGAVRRPAFLNGGGWGHKCVRAPIREFVCVRTRPYMRACVRKPATFVCASESAPVRVCV